ncbi:MAG: 6,7-dimethyl-8-ribityllumazine synthase [Candidatus Omnitrophica bacterium]|nr:6,7-dimethyl-8-ribityllumazine synthase [Candidatus Omnitrophota bacterium]
MSTYTGRLDARGRRFGLVVARFNEFITRRLLDAAQNELQSLGAELSDIDVAWVPGAMEIPLACRKMAETGRVEAVIAMACVLKGETSHFEEVARELAHGVSTVALDSSIPVIYGAITADSLEQAIHRAGGKMGNKGQDAARSAVEMANLFRSLGAGHPEVQARIRLLSGDA